jgi:hypothetical protein
LNLIEDQEISRALPTGPLEKVPLRLYSVQGTFP